MKIWITGSHSCWKTTLLNELKKEYWNKFNYIEEIAREVIKDLWKPQDMEWVDRWIFQYIIMMKQIIKEMELDNFISDRTVFDALVYSINNSGSFYEKIENKFQEHIKNKVYDIIFYVPIEFDLVDDWIRFEDKEYREFIDKEILKQLKKYNIDYITITWSIEDRVEQVKKHIKSLDR